MSIRMVVAVVSGLFAAVALGGSAGAEMFAPTKPAKPKTVTVTGCAQKGVPELCTIIKGPKDATYNISGANPPAPIGKKVILRGTVTDKHSFCGGLVLDNIKWMAVRGKCPAPKGSK
jgi:hypothetical protein